MQDILLFFSKFKFYLIPSFHPVADLFMVQVCMFPRRGPMGPGILLPSLWYPKFSAPPSLTYTILPVPSEVLLGCYKHMVGRF